MIGNGESSQPALPLESHRLAARTPLDIEAIYLAQGREIWAIFYAHCCDTELALDALHEAVLRLCQHDGDAVSNPRAWLLRVGQNWLHDARRRQTRRRQSTAELDRIVGPAPEPFAIAMDDESRSSIRRVFANLPVEDRELLVLRYALGWDSRRIAAAEQSTVGAIDMRLSRARRGLSAALQKAGVVQ